MKLLRFIKAWLRYEPCHEEVYCGKRRYTACSRTAHHYGPHSFINSAED